jgi:hypothetical protein
VWDRKIEPQRTQEDAVGRREVKRDDFRFEISNIKSRI